MSIENKPNPFEHPVNPNAERSACAGNPGYRVFANDTSSGRPWCWAAGDLESAKRLARTICENTAQDVEICRYVGTVQRKGWPTEFIAAREEK